MRNDPQVTVSSWHPSMVVCTLAWAKVSFNCCPVVVYRVGWLHAVCKRASSLGHPDPLQGHFACGQHHSLTALAVGIADTWKLLQCAAYLQSLLTRETPPALSKLSMKEQRW